MEPIQPVLRLPRSDLAGSGGEVGKCEVEGQVWAWSGVGVWPAVGAVERRAVGPAGPGGGDLGYRVDQLGEVLGGGAQAHAGPDSARQDGELTASEPLAETGVALGVDA